MNLVGYPLVLPDMIGGNGYGDGFWNGGSGVSSRPDKEIFLRWLQANTFMPSLQFSYVPWDYDSEVSVVEFYDSTVFMAQYRRHKFVRLHGEYTPYIMERFKLAVARGEPVNPPIW